MTATQKETDMTSDLKEIVFARTGKLPEACSDAELLGLVNTLGDEFDHIILNGNDQNARQSNDAAMQEVRHYRRRRWQDECKEREVKIRADFLVGYDNAMSLSAQPENFQDNPNIAAGDDWGVCIINAHGDDDSISPEFMATIRAGLCEAHVASTRFEWYRADGEHSSNPYRWIAARLEDMEHDDDVDVAA
jgi:hypothetical protein